MSSVNFSDIEIYKGATFDELLKQIHDNSNSKSAQIDDLIENLAKLIKTSGDAAMLVPLVAEYLDVGVKNDDQLIKMAGIIQRFFKNGLNAQGSGDGLALTEAERKELLQAAEDAQNTPGKVIKMGTG